MAHCPVLDGLATGAQGSIKTFKQTTLYASGPATSRVGVLAFPDIFGFESGRARADADALGALGYAVVIVDIVGGEYMTPGPSLDVGTWIRQHPYDTELRLHIQHAIEYLKTEAKVDTLAAYGYCFGAWVGAKLTTTETNEVVANVSFHPSWTVENTLHGDGAIEKLAAAVQVPQLLVCSGDEPALVRPGGAVHDILAARKDGSNVVEFAEMKHGFVARGDVDGDEKIKDAVMQAWHLAVQFLQTAAPLG